MDFDEITTALRIRAGDDCGLGAVLVFDCGTDGVIRIDGRARPNTVDNTDGDGDCRVRMDTDDLAALINGRLDGTVAYLTGRMKIAGDLSVALRLQKLMGRGGAPA
jgi:putative sterol carrier protein